MPPDDTSAASAKSSGSEPVVVGIGASAGGLKALRTFFGAVPEDSGLAFVVVVHLSPDHESHLADLLQPYVNVPVQQVTESVALRANQVYVIPPGKNLSAIDTHLRLASLEERRSDRAPIDHFFRTLARTHDGHAIGVILTGTGSDGSLGLKDIKEKGGLTIVQDPNEAEYDGMPQNAITSSLVDLVLPLAQIPAAIVRFVGTEPRVDVPKESEDVAEEARPLLHKVFAQVRVVTGRDFGRYKRSTILRRITRRMQMHQLEELGDYLQMLREQPDEVRLLGDDLLITVTSFFRDPEVFQKVKDQVIPALLIGKEAGDQLRVWTVGCATGEEAYSFAMLLLEQMDGRGDAPRLQVFASDLHEHSLQRARDGFFAGDIAVDVSPERLRRFFTKENGGYRIRKEVRETVLFAPHNLLSDPPFSKIDLISCRNVLIYLQRDAQRDAIEMFHYALHPGGHLLLGSSETVEGTDLFSIEERKACLYRKRNVPAPQPRPSVFPVTSVAALRAEARAARPAGEPMGYGTLHQSIVERHGAPSLLLSPDDKIVHMSPRAGRYLIHPGGEIVTNVLQLVREELRIDLRSALVAARDSKLPARGQPVDMSFDGKLRRVVVDVRPAHGPHEGFVLVTFDDTEADANAEPAGTIGSDATTGGDERLRRLERDVDLGRQRLQAIIEEYETTQEEMRAANEELQSTNEELRSTMEELETSREELQSMNEELQTVNQENRHKVEELNLLSSDLQNLLGASDIATVFLDRELRIMRFTPKAGALFNVRTTDRGRPISDITHRLGYPELRTDAEAVLARLVPIEREVQDETNRWYLTRVIPYRSIDDRIQGVVITFVDISDRRDVEDTLKQSDRRKEEFLATLAHELRNPLAAVNQGLLLLDVSANGDQDEQQVRHMMRRQVLQLIRLTEELLDVSRISRGELRLQKSRVDLARVMQQALESVETSTRDRKVDLALPREHVWLDGDPLRLVQVFGNLLSNACKFTESGGRIRIGAERRNDDVVVTVKDNGIGIPPDKLAGLFTMFKQLHHGQTRWREGLGIGLALVKQLVELHGGSVMASSGGSSRGTTFSVRLPVAEGPPPPDTATATQPAELTGLRILVVDDNHDVAYTLSLLLERANNQVQMVHTGAAALATAESFRPDLVLLDLGLPDLDGHEVARQIRAQPWSRGMLIVAASGWGQEGDRRNSMDAGLDAHMVKPVELGALARTVAQLRATRDDEHA